MPQSVENSNQSIIPKSVSPLELEKWCNDFLVTSQFKDYCPNGLQVDADVNITRIVTGVTACEALIDEAIAVNAQAILVHHGYFWKGENQPIVGMKGKRIRKLLQNNISLLAYHLPLDAHQEVGNNAQLCKQLNIPLTMKLFPESIHNPDMVGDIAILEQEITADELFNRISNALNKQPLHIKTHDRTYKKVAICSGGAQGFITQAAKMGCDAYLSGEISEKTTHEARELGIDYFCCGHHATEKGGVIALGNKIANDLNIEVMFIDIDNPA